MRWKLCVCTSVCVCMFNFCMCLWQTLRSSVAVRGQVGQVAHCLGLDPTMHCCRGHRLLRREPVGQRRRCPELWMTYTNSSQWCLCIFINFVKPLCVIRLSFMFISCQCWVAFFHFLFLRACNILSHVAFLLHYLPGASRGPQWTQYCRHSNQTTLWKKFGGRGKIKKGRENSTAAWRWKWGGEVGRGAIRENYRKSEAWGVGGLEDS